jgi:hypothetical protein
MTERVQVARAPSIEAAQEAASHVGARGAQNVRIAVMPDGSFVVTADAPEHTQSAPDITPINKPSIDAFNAEWRAWEDRRAASRLTGSKDHRASSAMEE